MIKNYKEKNKRNANNGNVDCILLMLLISIEQTIDKNFKQVE
jgi:hypothetical protein